MDGRWLSIQEFANYKGKSVSTVRRYIKAERVKFKEENGKYFVWAKGYQDPSLQSEKVFLELRLDNERLKKENRVLTEQVDELKMLVQIYEEEKNSLNVHNLPELPLDL
ncbi:MAG: hypothetical protein KC478_00530 [Bacteriovoracaceae bacterium]|nr:hypothetical protein [Bacteriovoracaceae bacterium]